VETKYDLTYSNFIEILKSVISPFAHPLIIFLFRNFLLEGEGWRTSL